MTMTVKCSACQVGLKVSAQHAGKQVKCPKCGQIVTVPGAAAGAVPDWITSAQAASSPPRPAAPAAPAPPKAALVPPKAAPPAAPNRVKAAAPPPAAAPKAPGRTSLPLLSFEELKVPPRLRRSIETKLGSEPMVWMGRPTPESFMRKAYIGMWVGLPLSALMIAGTVIGMQQVEGMGKWIALGIGGLMLLSLGLPLATMPIWVKMLINYRDCYVLTPTRAIVFDNEKILVAEARVFKSEDLNEREVFVAADGTGSITFKYEIINLGTRTRHKTETRNAQEGGREVKVTVRTTITKQEKASKGVGFRDIANVETVEALLRQTLNLGPPAQQNVA